MTTLYAHDTDHQNVVSWCYAHGKAEEFLGHDILLSEEPTKFGEGVHTVTLQNTEGEQRPALLFMWQPEGWPSVKGICVFGDDVRAVRHAAKLFADKERSF